MVKRDRNVKPALNDWHLWSEVTRSVSPLRRTPRPMPDEADSAGAPVPASASPPGDWSPSATPIRHAARTPPQRRPATQSQTRRPIEPRLERKLRRGQLPIDGTIDLHGLRQAEAHAALCRFVAARYARGDRTLLVITGKGLKKTGPDAIEQRGVLRHMLPVWLTEPALSPYIAGWEVSAQTHGGEGAYYVRLKRGGK